MEDKKRNENFLDLKKKNTYHIFSNLTFVRMCFTYIYDYFSL